MDLDSEEDFNDVGVPWKPPEQQDEGDEDDDFNDTSALVASSPCEANAANGHRMLVQPDDVDAMAIAALACAGGSRAGAVSPPGRQGLLVALSETSGAPHVAMGCDRVCPCTRRVMHELAFAQSMQRLGVYEHRASTFKQCWQSFRYGRVRKARSGADQGRGVCL